MKYSFYSKSFYSKYMNGSLYSDFFCFIKHLVLCQKIITLQIIFYSLWKNSITMLRLVTTQKNVLELLLLTINDSLYRHIYWKNVFLSVNEQDNVILKDNICWLDFSFPQPKRMSFFSQTERDMSMIKLITASLVEALSLRGKSEA